MAKIKNGATEVAKVIYIDETFGDVFETSDDHSIEAKTFQTENFELNDDAFGVLDSLDFRGAVQGVSNNEAAGAGDGTRWIVGATPSGAFAAFSPNQIVRSDGTDWIAEPDPSEGTLVYRKGVNKFYNFTNDTFGSGVWSPLNITGLHDYRDSVIDRNRLSPAAVAAEVVYDTVTFTADTAGAAGNVNLIFNGSDDLDTVVGAWNTANPSNTISFSGQAGTYAPAAGTASLAGGLDALTPSAGDRYLVGQPTDTAAGAWAGHAGEIAYYTGSAWEFEPQPDEGTMTFVEDENSVYLFNSDTFATGVWILFANGIYTAGNGIDISANVVSADLLANGGLKFSGGQIAVEPNDFAGSGLVDDGSDNLDIDWATDFTIDSADDKAFQASDLASTTNGEGASIVGVEDTHGVFDNDNVEDVLYELYQYAAYSTGVKYTAGAGGISKGDLVYVSAADTVLPLDITLEKRAVGVALIDAAAGEDVYVARHDEDVAGILTGATPDDGYYWNGTGWQTTFPAGEKYVWRGGSAKNATDLHLHVEFVKKNAA